MKHKKDYKEKTLEYYNQNNKVIENQQKELELLSSQFKDDCWNNIKLKHEKLYNPYNGLGFGNLSLNIIDDR